MRLIGVILFILLLGGSVIFLFHAFVNSKEISLVHAPITGEVAKGENIPAIKILPPPPPKDIPPQTPLENPPKIVKAIYATGWSAGSEKKVKSLIGLIKKSELNAIVIDIKDFSGYVLYDTDLAAPKKYGAVEIRIPKINTTIKRFHDEGIYVIGRLSVFQDQRLALARPDLALMSSSTGKLWKDKKNLYWIDVAAKESWEYNVAIAKEALGRGFDEINFDYIRFASDGDLNDVKYPYWNGVTWKREVAKSFFQYVRNELEDSVISADLFGLTTVEPGDMGIGQYWEYALPYFDYLAPMVYPSHYRSGILGYKNPADHPYEIVRYSLDEALRRVKIKRSEMEKALAVANTQGVVEAIEQSNLAKIRPWLQDFDLGADYNAAMIRKQIQAVNDSGGCGNEANSTTTGTAEQSEPCSDMVSGWMLWSPSNTYTEGALNRDERIENRE